MAAFPQVVRSTRYRLRDYLRATKACKLYDFEHGQWYTYQQAAALPPEMLRLPEASLVVAPAADR
jgi:hypothetical protein